MNLVESELHRLMVELHIFNRRGWFTEMRAIIDIGPNTKQQVEQNAYAIRHLHGQYYVPKY